MISIPTLLIIILSVLLAGVYAGLETGSYTLNRIRLRHRLQEGDNTAAALRESLKDQHIFVFTVLVMHNLAVYNVSRLTTQAYAFIHAEGHAKALLGFIPWNAEVAATFTLMLPLLLFAEVGPKNLFRKRANTLMYHCTQLLRFSILVCLPVTYPLRALSKLLTLRSGTELPEHEQPQLSFHRFRMFVFEGMKEGTLSPLQHRMVDRVIAINRLPVTDAMVPRDEFPSLEENRTVADFRTLVRNTGATLVAVHKGSATQVKGFVSLFDVLADERKPEAKLPKCRGQVLRLRSGSTLQMAFAQLRRSRQKIGVVVNAKGDAIGFIRISDIARYVAL